MQLGRVTELDKHFLIVFPKSISALVVTHCEFRGNVQRTGIVEECKSTKEIAASIGKEIYTVGFPDLNDILR